MDMGGGEYGEYIVVSDEEMEEAEPEKSRTIDIEIFVDLSDVDPIFFRAAYYVAPQSESDAHLAAIRPVEEMPVLETL